MWKLHKVAWVLLVIGGLNWGLTAFGYGIQNWIGEMASMIIFVVVGLAAVAELFGHNKMCRNCNPTGA